MAPAASSGKRPGDSLKMQTLLTCNSLTSKWAIGPHTMHGQVSAAWQKVLIEALTGKQQ